MSSLFSLLVVKNDTGTSFHMKDGSACEVWVDSDILENFTLCHLRDCCLEPFNYFIILISLVYFVPVVLLRLVLLLMKPSQQTFASTFWVDIRSAMTWKSVFKNMRILEAPLGVASPSSFSSNSLLTIPCLQCGLASISSQG